MSNLDNLDTCRDKLGSRNVAEGKGALGHLVDRGVVGNCHTVMYTDLQP